MQIDPTQPFISVEYTLPWETRNEARRGMCLPCSRATTQVLFYDIVHLGVHVNGLIQRFYNEHSKPGEYRLSAMLVCPPGGPIQNLPMPIVRHQRNAYSVYKDKNILYMKQLEIFVEPLVLFVFETGFIQHHSWSAEEGVCVDKVQEKGQACFLHCQ